MPSSPRGEHHSTHHKPDHHNSTYHKLEPHNSAELKGADSKQRNGLTLLGPVEIRELAQTLGVTPTKKLGQNFVHDANTVRRIVRIAGIIADDRVLEVGPGLGSLTLGLLETGAHVTAVEIDKRLAAQLPATVQRHTTGTDAGNRLTVIRDDAMRITDLPASPNRLVANLPYNVSVPVLLHLLATVPSIRAGVVMVQAEVGERLAATPGSKIYGGPSAKASWYGSWHIAAPVARHVFWPTPNVDSLLVTFTRHASEPGDVALRRATFALIDSAFQQRRKMLRKSLAPLLGTTSRAPQTTVRDPQDASLFVEKREVGAIFDAANVDPTARGEQLTVADFARIARTAMSAID